MISLAEVKRVAANKKLNEAAIERDHAIGWFLKGIYDNFVLQKAFIFKGGTALRKAYFEDYRFSKDLDFTLDSTKSIDLGQSISTVCQALSEKSGLEFTLLGINRTRQEAGGEAFDGSISFIGPRQQRGNPLRLKLDLTEYEKVVLKPRLLPLIHNFSDVCTVDLLVYPLEEILGEKLRTLIQRCYARDYYDIWAIASLSKDIDFKRVKAIFEQKCLYKGIEEIDFISFTNSNIKKIERYYEPSVGPQVDVLPDFEIIRKDVDKLLERIFM